MSGDRFDECLRQVLRFEGGYSDDPNDAGGATNLGITAATLARAHKAGIVAHNDAKRLTREEAAAIYRRFYWDPSQAGKLPCPLDMLVFDAAVNCGVGGAVRILQAGINYLAPGSNLAVDGAMGPKTWGALQAVLNVPMGARALAAAMEVERMMFYAEITDGEAATPARREQEVRNRTFLRGWIERLRRLWEVVRR